METNNIKDYESYIGKQVIGFKFEGEVTTAKGLPYNPEMDDYVGKVGFIKEYSKFFNSFTVNFPGDFWHYPADLVIKQLNQKEELVEMMEKDEESGIYDEDDNDKVVDPIIERVCNKFRQRSEVGLHKYNTTLADSADGIDKFLLHLQEELMDAVNYIETLKHKIQVLKDSL